MSDEDVWREHTADVLAALVRRSGDFGACEDAVQEALLAAAQQWPVDGTPDDPKAWLVRVASRRLIDAHRSTTSRERREEAQSSSAAALLDAPAVPAEDDTLRMCMLCAHPDLSDASRVALTLRAVAGLTTAQVAACFLVPEATMAQRISRAKATIRGSEAPFAPPTQEDAVARLHAVRHVVYLVFTAGHTTAAGDRLVDTDLQREALRLAERLHRALPRDPETAGLLALLLIDHARTAARQDAAGDLIPLDAQDRTRWDHAAIARGVALVEEALTRGAVGPFQLQAAIAAVHGEATTADETDWPQIEVLYRMLLRIAPSPMVELNLAAAVGMSQGPAAGLAALEPLLDDPLLARGHRVHAVRAHLLERAGRREEAASAYLLAASRTQSIPEQRYLNRRAAVSQDSRVTR
ncbi:RNA polymerase sigma factor [Janibacter limosus]|uniref:Sigma-70 family RNA polymerase sigma factor n=1 Tax=Janibacter limosus TaxID=53458 RepID=A0A4P6MZX0_9MICO|nr:sigma-70 family RNA polymerase sigma factor [Janibacter limosus]QBF47620.1 sigma-70 family RNA polymerase sigma factor [Janibacter limosus]